MKMEKPVDVEGLWEVYSLQQQDGFSVELGWDVSLPACQGLHEV